MPLRETLSGYWQSLQGELFPALEEELGPLGERYRDLVTVLELARERKLRLHRFKRTAGLPRVRRVLGALKGFAPETLLDVGSGRGARES